MALSIEEIMRRMGIKESSGSFDQEEEDELQTRLMEDTRKFTAGNEGDGELVESHTSAPQDPRILAQRARNEQRAVEAGLAPDPRVAIAQKERASAKSIRPKLDETLVDEIRQDEASPSDYSSGEWSFYEEEIDGKTIRNLGPGLNLEDPLTERLFEEYGGKDFMNTILTNKGISGIKESRVILEKVFRERVHIAQSDAKDYVGRSAWKSLDPEMQKALTNLSYNLGAKKLGKFVKTKELIDKLVAMRTAKGKIDKIAEARLIDHIGDEMSRSLWFKQTKTRGRDVVQQFVTNGAINMLKRKEQNG